ncbi:hypothetical protein RIF29_24337 [Crotalaria pallida]|uniref:Uncharacterized protein n=1 Tax=Crotalaria pallida TaxID=3830 RepID=A0AAN9EJJ1_CROPI
MVTTYGGATCNDLDEGQNHFLCTILIPIAFVFAIRWSTLESTRKELRRLVGADDGNALGVFRTYFIADFVVGTIVAISYCYMSATYCKDSLANRDQSREGFANDPKTNTGGDLEKWKFEEWWWFHDAG